MKLREIAVVASKAGKRYGLTVPTNKHGFYLGKATCDRCAKELRLPYHDAFQVAGAPWQERLEKAMAAHQCELPLGGL